MSDIGTDLISTWTPGIEPLMKGGRVQRGYIHGPCSSERRDLQGEKIYQDGADFSAFTGGLMKGGAVGEDEPVGAVTHEHPIGIFNIVGEPEDLKKGKLTNGTKAHFLTTRLHLDVGNQLAEDIWTQVERLRAAKSRIKLGYSVDGGARKRASYDKTSPLYKDVLESVFPNVVITARPRNRDAMFDAVCASLKSMEGGEDVLRATLERIPSDLIADLSKGGLATPPELDVAQEFYAAAQTLRVDVSDVVVASVVRSTDPKAWDRAVARVLRNLAASAA